MLTTAQSATLKAAILGNSTLAAFITSGQTGALAVYANTVPPTGTTLVWRPNISAIELNGAIVWSDFIALSQGQRDAYRAMTQAPIDATQATIRAGFTAVFGAASPTLAAITALAQRNATRFEALYVVNGVTPMFGQRLDVPSILKAMA